MQIACSIMVPAGDEKHSEQKNLPETRVPGFEPGSVGTKIPCLTIWRYPITYGRRDQSNARILLRLKGYIMTRLFQTVIYSSTVIPFPLPSWASDFSILIHRPYLLFSYLNVQTDI